MSVIRHAINTISHVFNNIDWQGITLNQQKSINTASRAHINRKFLINNYHIQMNYGYRRRFRAYPRFGRAYRRTTRYGSSAQRRAAGNYRAALQQRDSTQINLSIPTTISCKSTTGPHNITNYFKGATELDATVQLMYDGVYALNIWDLIRKSTFYQSYANMYDQIKLDRIRIKLTPGSFIQSTGSAYQSYTVVTAWDRTGLSEEQLSWNTDAWGQLNGPGGDKIGNAAAPQYGLWNILTADDISTYSSAVTKPITSNANTSIVRTIYPRTSAEKGYYVNTADIDAWYDGCNYNHWYGIVNERASYGLSQNAAAAAQGADPIAVPVFRGTAQISSTATQKNPCFILESPNIPWKPTLLIGLMNKGAISIAGEDPQYDPEIQFYVEADIGVTFRGLRKAPIVQ